MNDTELRSLSELRALLEGLCRASRRRARGAPPRRRSVACDSFCGVPFPSSPRPRLPGFSAGGLRTARDDDRPGRRPLAARGLAHGVERACSTSTSAGFEECFPDVAHPQRGTRAPRGDHRARAIPSLQRTPRGAISRPCGIASPNNTTLRGVPSADALQTRHGPRRFSDALSAASDRGSAAGRFHQPRQPVAALSPASWRQLPGLLAEGPPGKGCRPSAFYNVCR